MIVTGVLVALVLLAVLGAVFNTLFGDPATAPAMIGNR